MNINQIDLVKHYYNSNTTTGRNINLNLALKGNGVSKIENQIRLNKAQNKVGVIKNALSYLNDQNDSRFKE